MSKGTILKTAIVGCGKIADNHAVVMAGIEGCEIVGVCDREPLMAEQLYERFPVKKWFSDLEELLSQARPDVVHITTPPESHFALAKICLEHGCNVYVEKPFTLFESDARQLIGLAERKGLKLTAGHDAQFGTAARRMRELVRSGYLGGGPVHMESYYGYEMGQAYAQALLGDAQHWVRRLPGKLLHNVISHGIARIAEFMTSDSPVVIAHGFVSPFLRKLGEREVFDELRVILSSDEGVTGYFTFSSQMRPLLHEFRAYGTKNGLVLDPDQETLIKLRGSRYKSYAEKFVPPVTFAKQYLGNLRTNLGYFLRRDFQMKSGLNYLIRAFYRSIVDGTPVPIPYREILLTARIMDSIFAQLGTKRSTAAMPLESALIT
jgi:predicted dehydrogenase